LTVTSEKPTARPARHPVLAVVGRPNVGKSTLVNRLLGRRAAVVEETPGVTRDRVAYDASWRGRSFVVVDTGGWERGACGLAGRIAEHAEIAADAADAVLFVVDVTTGATEPDAEVARLLQRTGRPTLVAANKVDDAQSEADAAGLWSLGLGEPHPVSALHGRGSGDLLDAILNVLPQAPLEVEADAGLRRVALVGRPNVGKSSLLNQLARTERALVDAAAGTTRDPVDSEIRLGGEDWQFIDTAGLRRRARTVAPPDFYASRRTEQALAAAEVAVVLLDASEPIAEQDQRVIAAAVDAGRAVVVALNKWDLVDADRRRFLDREIERDLARVAWAPRINVSARTGRGVDKLPRALHAALEGWETRVPTGRLNAWLADITAATPPPARAGRAPRVLFATQADIRPPRFVLFATGFLESGYRRFLERRLRESFGFSGSPVEIAVRLRERRRR
jgi:GTP-binding protein